MEPWIKLYRKFTEWEWYRDINCKVVFLHLLLTANWKPKKWQGIVVGAGELVTSRASLAEEVDLSVQQIRTSLKKLSESGVIKIDTTNKYTVIHINNYEKYQEKPKNQPTNNQAESVGAVGVGGSAKSKSNKRVTINQPSNNQQITTPKELKKDRIIEDIDNRCCCNNNIYNINNTADEPKDNAAASADIAKVFSDYEKNIGVLSPMIVDILRERITAQGAALVSLAIVEAVKNNAKTVRYIERVLLAWEDAGIKTVDAAKLRIAERWQKASENDMDKLPGNVQKSSFRNYPQSDVIGETEKKAIAEMMKSYGG